VRPAGATPERFLVDGQRRVTTLFQVLGGDGAVRLPARPTTVAQWYFLDVAAALDPRLDADDAWVVSARQPIGTASDGSAVSFPLQLVFGTEAACQAWQRGFVERRRDTDTGDEIMRRFDDEVIGAFRGYAVPVITVGRDRTRWSVRVHGGQDGPQLSDRFRVH